MQWLPPNCFPFPLRLQVSVGKLLHSSAKDVLSDTLLSTLPAFFFEPVSSHLALLFPSYVSSQFPLFGESLCVDVEVTGLIGHSYRLFPWMLPLK